MMKVARLHTLFGLCFAIVGMLLGIHMASSQNHVQHVTHAHIMLLGLVVSLLYGMVYRLWLPEQPAKLAMIQLALHHGGTLALTAGLFVLYGGMVAPPKIEPVLAVSSLLVLAAAVLMLYVFVRQGQARPQAQAGASDTGLVRDPQ